MATYNSLQRSGTVITDPHYLLTMEVEGQEPPSDFPLGAFSLNGVGITEAMGYLVMRGWSVPIKDQDEWIETNKPVLVVTVVESGKEIRYDHTGNKLETAS